MRSTPTASRTKLWRWIIGLTAGALVALLPAATESAIANGDTRTLSLVHAHTHETITATYLVDGHYDQAVLDKLNWFLRDWRRDEPTHMDPRLFDTVWEVYRESGSQQPIMVMSAYRSPETNAMLRRRSRQVAEHSQHILGKAMDQHYMDVPMSRIRELGMKLQRGGVGFYPTAGTPFVHLDVGGVRHWPRMSYDQLARLFPDGKTVHIPSNGQPLPGYELARAELEGRGDGSYPTATQLKSKGFFAWLFGTGGNSDEDDDNAAAGVKTSRAAPTRMASAPPPNAADTAPSYGKNASDRVSGGGAFFDPAPPRTLFAPAAPVAEARAVPEPAPIPLPVAPAQPAQPSPVQAVALAVPPTISAGNPETGELTAIRNIPVGGPVLPLPPRRPNDLASAEPAAPLPPSRPTALLGVRSAATPAPHDTSVAAQPGPHKPDAIASLLTAPRAGRLPDVITQGAGPAARSAPRALGYAAMAVLSEPSRGGDSIPMPVARPQALLSTHLDRSNFRTLTRPETTDQSVGRSALGAAVPPLRGAVRGDLGALVPKPAVRAESFQARPSDLSSNRFSGQVIKPAARATTTPSRTDVD